jgi:hypothetical protein
MTRLDDALATTASQSYVADAAKSRRVHNIPLFIESTTSSLLGLLPAPSTVRCELTHWFLVSNRARRVGG